MPHVLLGFTSQRCCWGSDSVSMSRWPSARGQYWARWPAGIMKQHPASHIWWWEHKWRFQRRRLKKKRSADEFKNLVWTEVVQWCSFKIVIKVIFIANCLLKQYELLVSKWTFVLCFSFWSQNGIHYSDLPLVLTLQENMSLQHWSNKQ